jgi:hypothetical protein
MANANAQTHNIDLASPNLNLDKYKLGVSQFDGFNYRNSPFISHEIKNLYTNTKSADVFIDEDNDEYKLDGYDFKKNGETIYSFNNKCVSIEEIPTNTRILYNAVEYDVIVYTETTYCVVSYTDDYVFVRYHKLFEDQLFRVSIPDGVNKIIDVAEYVYGQCNHICVAVVTNNGELGFVVFDATFSPIIFWILSRDVSDNPIRYNSSYDYVLCSEWQLRTDQPSLSNFYYSYILFANNIVSKTTDLSSSVVILKAQGYQPLAFDIDDVDFVDGNNQTIDKNKILGTKYGLINTSGVAANSQYTQSGNYHLWQFNNVNAWFAGCLGTGTIKLVFHYRATNSLGDEHSVSEFGATASITQEPSMLLYNKYGSCIPCFKIVKDNKETYISLTDKSTNTIDLYNTVSKKIAAGYRIPINDEQGDEKINLIFDAGNFVGISVSESEYYRGTLLFPFFEIDDIRQIIYPINYSQDSISNYKVLFVCGDKLYSLKITNNIKFGVLLNRYLIFNTIEYYNTYDTKTNTMYHIADDYYNYYSIKPIVYDYEFKSYLDIKSGFAASSVSSYYEQDKNPFPSAQLNSKSITSCHWHMYDNISMFVCVSNYETPNNRGYSSIEFKSFPIDCYFIENLESNVPTYLYSILNYGIKYLYEKNIVYSNTEGNLLLPIPLLVKSDNLQVPMIYNEDISFNAPIHIQNGSPTGLYFLLAAQIDAEYYFTIQTQLYCIIDDWICSYTYKDGIADNIKRVANVYGLDFLCSTPISAFFWSRYNKTIYQFQGDALLHRGQCIDEIEHIYQVKYNSATNDIIMCCDAYTIILSEQYAFKVANETKTVSGQTVEIPYTDVFWTNTDLCLRNTDHILMIRYNAAPSPYTKQNIIVRTQLYGLADNQLSETDCVYVRVFNAEHETDAQTVTIGGFALTDKKMNFTPQTYTITTNGDLKWDEDWTCYLRYQPTFQKSLGIQVEIESTVPITYIGVSNIADTKMVTKN